MSMMGQAKANKRQQAELIKIRRLAEGKPAVNILFELFKAIVFIVLFITILIFMTCHF
jgi:hypothetical protein